MTTLEFLSHLSNLGVRLQADGEKLRCSAPPRVLTPALKAGIAERKREILTILRDTQAAVASRPQAIGRVSRDGHPPLSFAQQRLWLMHQLDIDTSAYNISKAIGLSGRLNVGALEMSFSEIVRRHEALRTTFVLEDTMPVQIISPAAPLTLPVIDLSSLGESAREAEAHSLAVEEGRRPFDLENGPVFRIKLLRLGENEHIALLTLHHIVSDLWSMQVLIKELAALYNAFCAGKPPSLPELPIQYADFAHWQREWMSGDVLESHLSYWKRQLQGSPPMLDLPTDRPRPPAASFRGARHTFVLPADLVESLRMLSRTQGVTLFMLLLAAFKTLLYRYTGYEDIVVGTDTANRSLVEIEGLIGFFVNMLVMRTDMSGNVTFLELLGRVRNVVLSAFAHQEIPFEKLVEELQTEHDNSRHPLFQVEFGLHAAPTTGVELEGLSLTVFEESRQTAKFDLELMMVESRAGIQGSFEYSTDLFNQSTVERLAAHFITLLKGIVADPNRRLRRLPLMTAPELDEIVVGRNRTYKPYPRDVCFHEIFARRAREIPDSVAVICNGQSITYGRLNTKANIVAHGLRAVGAGCDETVAIVMDRDIEYLVSMLGILKAGAAFVPLDPNHPEGRTRSILEQSRCGIVITRDGLKEHVLRQIGEVAQVVSFEQMMDSAPPTTEPDYVGIERSLAYVIFTSGSTGNPKGVMIEQRGMLNHLYAKVDDLGITENDLVAQTATQTFDIFIWQFLAALLVGGRVSIFTDEDAWEPSKLLSKVESEGVTILETVPSHMKIILEELESDKQYYDLSSLRYFIVNAEPLLPEQCDRWLRMWPEIAIVNMYGVTECSDDACHFKIASPPARDWPYMPISGTLPNMTIFILDPDQNPVPAGVTGELCIGGVGVGRGYLNDPAVTAGVFIPDPFSAVPGARLYRTGDLVRSDLEGIIEFVGRVDRQVKIRGFRIENGEIEAVLAQHPAVDECLVMAREDERGEKRLVGYIISKSESAPSASELQEFLREKLPEYMVPASFVALEAFPLNANGKVDWLSLPAPENPRAQTEALPEYMAQPLIQEFPMLALPTDRPRSKVHSFRGARHSFRLSENIVARLKQISEREGVTQFIALLAAFKTLLYRYSRQPNIVIGLGRVDSEGLIALFDSTPLMQTSFDWEPRFRELLKRVKPVAPRTYRQQEALFRQPLEMTGQERNPIWRPPLQVMFVMENAPLDELGLTDEALSAGQAESAAAVFDLCLSAKQAAEEVIEATFRYNAELFEPTSISRMAGHFQTLLDAITADPDQRVSKLPLMSEAERRQLQEEWCGKNKRYERGRLIHELIERQRADSIALIFEGEEVSYGEMNRRANQLARHLRSLSVGPEVMVAICMERSVEMIVGLLGVLKAGGAYVPMDPTYPKERLAFMLEDSNVPVVLTQARLLDKMPDHKGRVICLDEYERVLAKEDGENLRCNAAPENSAYVIYTSGSTGRPKGVVISHESLVNQAFSMIEIYGLDPTHRLLQFVSLSFDASVEEIFLALASGASLVLHHNPAEMTPADVLSLCEEAGITSLYMPPSYWHQLVDEMFTSQQAVPESIKLVITGGESPSVERVEKWAQSLKHRSRLVCAYGPAEATVTATVYDCPMEQETITKWTSVPIGRPVFNRQVYILDYIGQPVPVGVPGELHIGGLGLARGYLNLSGLTAEKFTPNPFAEGRGERLYKTGDLARYLPDGVIEFLGRIDNQVKIRGFRIEIGEIEARLMEHPSVREAVVVTYEDAVGDTRLVGYVVSKQKPGPTTFELRTFLRDKMPETMVPYTFVNLDVLPLTPGGKIDRQALPSVDRARPETNADYVAARDTIEFRLVVIWEDILHVSPIGIKDNFFELGGHSLTAVTLMGRVQKMFKQSLPLAVLFQAATIEHLADVLRKQTGFKPDSPLVAMQPNGSKRPFFCMHPGSGEVLCYVSWSRHMGQDQPFYALQDPNLHGDDDPYMPLEEMAALYIKAIQNIDPEGPYLLGGWSFGGQVGFEMAQQLMRQGYEVALLAIVDTVSPAYQDKRFQVEVGDDAKLLAIIASELAIHGAKDVEQLTREIRPLALNDQLRYVHNYLIESWKLASLPEYTQGYIYRALQVFKTRIRVGQQYEAQKYPGRITLFRASERKITETRMDSTLGWSSYSTQPVEVHIIEGRHATIGLDPNAKALCEKIKECIAKISFAGYSSSLSA